MLDRSEYNKKKHLSNLSDTDKVNRVDFRFQHGIPDDRFVNRSYS